MINISYSEIRCYKTCRRKYYLAYVEGLKPINPPEPLSTGSSFHEKVAAILKDGAFEYTGDKTDAMAYAWMTYALPKLPALSNSPEEFFEVELAPDVTLRGVVDARAVDGLPVEHKTCGYSIDEKYQHRLLWDDQVPTYLIYSGDNEMWYTVVQKPSIRIKKGETDEQFHERMIRWYDDETDSKVQVFKVRRDRDELEEKREEIIAIAREINECKFHYRNPSACSILGCEYESICLEYDPEFVIGFERKKGRVHDQDTESV
jgi:hypothetical protein